MDRYRIQGTLLNDSLLRNMTLSIGDSLIDFNLKNANTNIGGDEINATKFAQENGLVVAFECNHCPYVVASVLRMNSLAKYCFDNGIGFVGINSNDSTVYETDSFEHMVKRADKGMPYPYLHDEDQSIASQYVAKRTPEFFLFNKDKSLVYKGRMDDSPKNPADITSTDLLDAINAVLSGNEPEIKTTESIGCSVKWKA